MNTYIKYITIVVTLLIIGILFKKYHLFDIIKTKISGFNYRDINRSTIIGGIIVILTLIGIYGYYIYNRKQIQNKISPVFYLTGKNAKTPKTISGNKIVAPSGSLEYTYSVLLHISDYTYKYGEPKAIFSKIPSISVNFAPESNDIQIRVYTTSGYDTIVCKDIVLNKWFQLTITVFNQNIEVYINGKLVVTRQLNGFAKIGVGDLIVNENNGFKGRLSKLHYFNTALNSRQVYDDFMSVKSNTIDKPYLTYIKNIFSGNSFDTC